MAGKYNKHKQDGSHLGFPISMILATVDLQVTSILPMSQLPFRFRRKSSKQIFKMAAMAAIWDFLSERFELILIYKSLRCYLPSFESIGLSVQKKKRKIHFQDGRHLGFPIGTILAIFDLQVIPMLPTNFLINWPLVQENKRKSSISDPYNLSYFKSTGHFNASYQVSSQLAFRFRRRSEK